MKQRDLYIAAYDISAPSRLRKALKAAKAYATGGQKSVYEVFLTAAEKAEFLATLANILDLDEDRFALIRLDPRAKVYGLGIAVQPADPSHFYIG